MKQCPCCFHVFEDEELIDVIDYLDKEKPKGCICNTREWGYFITPVCKSFHPMSKEEPDICQSCEHEEGCHS